MQKQLTIKILLIFFLALLILIPVSMVKYKAYERQTFFETAKSSIAKSTTGQQTFFTPVLVIPYQIIHTNKSGFYHQNKQAISDQEIKNKTITVMPHRVNSQIQVTNTPLKKGIYTIPVYNSKIEVSGRFDTKKIRDTLQNIRNAEGFKKLDTAYLAIHISDMRGIGQDPKLMLNQQTADIKPGSRIPRLIDGLHSPVELNQAIDTYEFVLSFSLRGMESLSILALADNATSNLQSNWPHPKFIGNSLPEQRAISPKGFSASWSTSLFSNNNSDLLASCVDRLPTSDIHSCTQLSDKASGVNFIDPVNIYLQSERAIKYAVLFIGLGFISFFIFEQISGRAIHPVQYTFVGLAIAIFYLLLISLAEHLTFAKAYLISAAGCISLLLFYVRHLLGGLKQSLLFTAMFTALYTLLYVIVQSEDFALLMGSILVFSILAVLMYVTRKIDWYNLSLPDSK